MALNQTVKALEERLAVVTEFTSGILLELDGEGRYRRVWVGDPALLAKPVPELLGRTALEVFGPDGAKFVTLIEGVLQSGDPASLEYALDVPAGRRTFLCEARLATFESGEPRVMVLVRDITEQTELKAKLVEAERLAAVGLLAASVGHEIKQPLAFATTSLEVLGAELASGSPRAKEALEHVRDAIRRISAIASSVGVIATDRARGTQTRDVARPIEAALDLCASQLVDRARLDVVVPPMPAVRGNEGELCQVFSNLLLNAAQAMDAWAPRNRVTIVARDEGDFVRVTVSDTGAGIKPETLVRIFDPFFTTKPTGRGTGLGLFVSRRIVEAIGGTITVESVPNVGTSAHVLLPIATPERPRSDPALDGPSGRLDILVVDDEATFLRSLEMVLSEMHDVTMCRSSREALAIVKADPSRFDVILCDLSMPEVDGVAFHAEVDRLGIADRFVIMSAGAFTERTAEFVARTKCRRITKPFPPAQLFALLAAVGARPRA